MHIQLEGSPLVLFFFSITKAIPEMCRICGCQLVLTVLIQHKSRLEQRQALSGRANHIRASAQSNSLTAQVYPATPPTALSINVPTPFGIPKESLEHIVKQLPAVIANAELMLFFFGKENGTDL